MKLEVGMYVRYKNGIGKIVGRYVKGVLIDKGIGGYFRTENNDIFKASHNIIDLIEVGDFVNGFRIDEVEYSKSTIYIGNTKKVIEQALWSNDIKSIVTKEQFESMSYKVGN